MPRFDAYVATTTVASSEAMLAAICAPGDTLEQGEGILQFKHRVMVRNSDGHRIGNVMWGGGQGDRVYGEVKGDRTPMFVDTLRKSVEKHRCTRVDSCEDFEAPGAWDSLLGEVLQVKEEFKLYGPKAGDWDMPEKGRTQYLGSPSSVCQFRLYEKGKQPEYLHLNRPDWVRAEMQVRPKGDAKTAYSNASPDDVWGASPFVRDLAARLLNASVGRLPAGTVFKHSDAERRLRWLCKQYGPALLELRNDVGTWECVGLTIGATISQLAKERKSGVQ